AAPVPVNFVEAGVTKSGPASAIAGNNITYHLSISGPSSSDFPAYDVTLTDTLPAGLSFVSLTQTGGPTYSCTTGQTISCTRSIPITTPATFDLVAKVTAASGSIVNTATASAQSFDPISANNSASVTTAIVAAPVPTL